MSCIGHISSMFLKAKYALKLSFQPKGALLCGWAVKVFKISKTFHFKQSTFAILVIVLISLSAVFKFFFSFSMRESFWGLNK